MKKQNDYCNDKFQTLAFMVDVVEEIISIEDEEIVAVSDSSLSHCKSISKELPNLGTVPYFLLTLNPY